MTNEEYLTNDVTLDNWQDKIPIDLHYDQRLDLVVYIKYLLKLNNPMLKDLKNPQSAINTLTNADSATKNDFIKVLRNNYTLHDLIQAQLGNQRNIYNIIHE